MDKVNPLPTLSEEGMERGKAEPYPASLTSLRHLLLQAIPGIPLCN